MKLAAPFFSFLLSASLVTGEIVCARRDLKADLEGSAQIVTGACFMSCDWGVKGKRNLLRKTSRQLLLAVPVDRQLEVKSVEVEYVDCTLGFGGLEYTQSLPFPEGWTQIFKEADTGLDYYGLSTEVSFDLGAVEGQGTSCSITGSLEIELEVEVVGDDKPTEALVYDDSDISVSC